MNSMRKFLCVLTAVMLGAFALPSFGAPQFAKQYYLTMASDPLTPTTVVAQLSNVTISSGNSNISSFQLSITSGNAKITGYGPLSKGTATITNNGHTIFFSGITPIKPGTAASNFSITLGDCGDFITWSVDGVWTGSMGDTFAFFQPVGFPNPNMTPSVSCGVLACSETEAVPSSVYSATVTRGTYDKDGVTTDNPVCGDVPLTVTDFGAGVKHFQWPLSGPNGDDAAAFLYTVSFGSALTHVSWLPANATQLTAVYITGPACLPRPTLLSSPAVLPAPYGVLAAPDTTGASTILVDTTGAVVAHPGVNVPFDVIIGTDRLTVSYGHGPANSETWKVVARDVGNTSGPLGVLGQRVMYTPLPILTGYTFTTGQLAVGYQNGLQAQMCIVQQGPPATTFIDIGDAYHAP
jgi:hypothetical protein